MNEHVHTSRDLTKNQSLVMDALQGSDAPLSAYTILDQLRDHGFRAPLQVYRALEKLVEFGLVHRLESLNAFVACRHSSCDAHEAIIFMICDKCGLVNEVADSALSNRLSDVAQDRHFTPRKSTVELRGTCGQCLAA